MSLMKLLQSKAFERNLFCPIRKNFGGTLKKNIALTLFLQELRSKEGLGNTESLQKYESQGKIVRLGNCSYTGE